MSQFVAFLNVVRRTAIEYTFAFLKTADRSEVIGYAGVAVAIVLLVIAVA
jgi:hypothetical protein